MRIKKMEDKNFTIIDENGNEFLCEILFTFHSDEFNKDYVVYSIPGESDEDEIEVSAACYVDSDEEGKEGELLTIESEEEWAMLQDVLSDFEAQNFEKASPEA